MTALYSYYVKVSSK